MLLPWAIGLVGLLYAGISDGRISKRQQTADGLITVHEPQNHDRYGYVFFVDGKSYSGWELPRKDGVAVGQRVTVYFDPRNPEKNALMDFEELGWEEFGPVVYVLVGSARIVALVWRTRGKARAARASGRP